MNSFYIAKKQLKGAGQLDIAFAILWGILILIFAIYNFGYLLPNKYAVGTTDPVTSTNVNVAAGIVATKGYQELFNVEIFNFLFFRLKLGTLVLTLGIFTLICFISKVLLGTLALVKFFKGKSIQHIYASLAVIFLPGLGGIIAINTYKATTSKLAPKYLAAHSFVRFRMRKLWNTVAEEYSLENKDEK